MTSSRSFEVYKVDVFQEDSVIHEGPGFKEVWSRQKRIDGGAFGVVWLEQEDTTGKLRAVKVLPKSHSRIAREQIDDIGRVE